MPTTIEVTVCFGKGATSRVILKARNRYNLTDGDVIHLHDKEC